MKLKILIVEDDFAYSLKLERTLEELGHEVVKTVDNSGDALDFIYSQPPDLILMDIDINGSLSGLEIGAKTKHLGIPVLFMTSHSDDEHFEAAQQSNFVGYIVKPFQKYTLKSALQMATIPAKEEQEQKKEDKEEGFLEGDFLFFKKADLYQKVAIQDIAFIRTSNIYSEVILEDGTKFIIRFFLSDMEKILPKNDFFRSHRKFIVRLDKIESVDMVLNRILVCGEYIPFSRSKKEEMKKKIRFLNWKKQGHKKETQLVWENKNRVSKLHLCL